ncbi:MAG: dUTP diphosphatase [Nanoarchaeota archaeon]
MLIPSGIKADIPEGYALIAFNKSGVSVKKELDVLACVCDAGYQGEIHLNLVNTGNQNISIEPGEKIVQFILLSISNALPKEVKLEELYSRESRRGDGGFGSTGEK